MSVASWAVGFAVGAGVVAANFWAMEATLRLVLLPGARAPRLVAALGFGARLMVAGLILGFALRHLDANPIAMVVGVSVVPFALLIRFLVKPGNMPMKVI